MTCFKELRELKFLTTGSRVVEYYNYDYIPDPVAALVACIDYLISFNKKWLSKYKIPKQLAAVSFGLQLEYKRLPVNNENITK